MRFSMLCKVPVLVALFISPAAFAQSPAEEIAPLPTTLSTEQLQSLSQLIDGGTPAIVQETAQPRARRRLPRPPQLLTPEETEFKLAVEKLGVDQHRFVHCDLPKGKVRTGVITSIGPNGFVLKDGIIFDHFISYTDLKAAPRPVAAVGTRIGQGLKWAGLIAVAIPLLPFGFLFWDDC